MLLLVLLVVFLLPISTAFVAAVAAPPPAEATAAAPSGTSSAACCSMVVILQVVVLTVGQPVVHQYCKLIRVLFVCVYNHWAHVAIDLLAVSTGNLAGCYLRAPHADGC
jgi:hypothetical protein